MAADGEKGAGPAAAEKGVKGAAAAVPSEEVAGGKMITLKSKEGAAFGVPEAAARLWSETLRGMIEGGGCPDGVLPLPDVDAVALGKVAEYLNHHGAAPAPNPFDTAALDRLKEWDRDLVDGLGTQRALFDLIHAADHLLIQGLLDAACGKVAGMMKRKTPDQIRSIFNIVDDYTEEEMAEIRQELAWAFADDHGFPAADDEDGFPASGDEDGYPASGDEDDEY